MSNRTADQILTAIRTAINTPLDPDTPDSLVEARQQERTHTQAIERSITAIVDALHVGDQLVRTVLVHEIVGTHRHLQQQLILALLQALGDLGTLHEEWPGGYADARNAFAMKLCVKLRTCLSDELFY